MRKGERLLLFGFIVAAIASGIATSLAVKLLNAGPIICYGLGFAAGILTFIAYVIAVTMAGK